MTSQQEIEVPPGTEIYGVLYRDSSAGAWQRDRAAALRVIEEARQIGLTPCALIRLRMKFETLWASE